MTNQARSHSGKQQLSVQNITSMVQNQGGEALLQVNHHLMFYIGILFDFMLDYFSPTKFCHQHAETKGLAPELMEGVMGILKPSGGAGAGAGGDGGGAGGGIDMAAVMGLISSLTNRWLGWCDPSIVEEAILRRMVNVALAQGWRRRRSCRWFPPAIGRRCRWRRWRG